MPLTHYHLKGPSLLALLDARLAGFCPLCEMEKLLNDPKTPPKVKKRLRQDLAAYGRVVAQAPCPIVLYGEKQHKAPWQRAIS